MKVLPTARILLIDSDSVRRQDLRAALTALGVGAVFEAETVDPSAAPTLDTPDVVVVRADDADHVPEHPYREGSIPAVLIVDAPATLLARIGGRAGYDAAVGLPLMPRFLYRRIGSVLQRARRNQRPSLSAERSAAEGKTAELVVATPAL